MFCKKKKHGSVSIELLAWFWIVKRKKGDDVKSTKKVFKIFGSFGCALIPIWPVLATAAYIKLVYILVPTAKRYNATNMLDKSIYPM